MGFPTQTMQEVIDITKAFEEAVKSVKLPDGYYISTAQICVFVRDSVLANCYVNTNKGKNYSSHIELSW